MLTTDDISRLNHVRLHPDQPPPAGSTEWFMGLVDRLGAEISRLRCAVIEHHAQKADDRCIEDDDRLYAAFGLPPCDRRVGDKAAMLENCKRFIENRCEGGGPWKSYADLEAENARLRGAIKEYVETHMGSRPGETWSDYCQRRSNAFEQLNREAMGRKERET